MEYLNTISTMARSRDDFKRSKPAKVKKIDKKVLDKPVKEKTISKEKENLQ